MMPDKPDLIVLPFKASLIGNGVSLTLEQTLRLLRSSQREFLLIERSHPGASDAIGFRPFVVM